MLRFLLLLTITLHATAGSAFPSLIQEDGRAVSESVFEDLEELARIVDISYCVGSTGIQKPFKCLSRCSDFEGFELVTVSQDCTIRVTNLLTFSVHTWNTGPLLSDSCGYIALSHAPHKKRVLVAFRGTYSIANTIADLSTIPSEYAPFPADGEDETCALAAPSTKQDFSLPRLLHQNGKRSHIPEKCVNCTVHSGFMGSWRNTRCTIIPHVEQVLTEHPDYELVLVGHSLGGAVAALAGLEFQARGWKPVITTFGEPKIGNLALNRYIDRYFNLNATRPDDATYRRVTHVDDPVPLLPLKEWGYRMHAGEIYISKPSLPPMRGDLEHCTGDEDPNCIASGESLPSSAFYEYKAEAESVSNSADDVHEYWSVPKRYRLWQLFFAHRDYFWRLGLCLPGGYPWDWKSPVTYDEARDAMVMDDEL